MKEKTTHRPDAPMAARLPTRGQSDREVVTGIASAPVLTAVGGNGGVASRLRLRVPQHASERQPHDTRYTAHRAENAHGRRCQWKQVRAARVAGTCPLQPERTMEPIRAIPQTRGGNDLQWRESGAHQFYSVESWLSTTGVDPIGVTKYRSITACSASCSAPMTTRSNVSTGGVFGNISNLMLAIHFASTCRALHIANPRLTFMSSQVIFSACACLSEMRSPHSPQMWTAFERLSGYTVVHRRCWQEVAGSDICHPRYSFSSCLRSVCGG